MTVLVTGATGVVGLHVMRELAEHGDDVVGVSRGGLPPESTFVLGDFLDRVSFLRCDVRDLDSLRSIATERGIEGIIHTAALTGEAQARARPQEVIAVNLVGTANVLEVARALELRRVVSIGSSSEYGPRPDLRPITEDEVAPEGLYAETKRMGHLLGQRYRSVFGLDFITCRVNSVFGPGTRFNPHRGLVGNTLIAYLCRAAARGEAVRLESGASYPRGWTHASDTAMGIRLAYEKEQPAYDVYNIAAGVSYLVSEVVDALRALEPGADISVGPGRWEDDPFQAGALRGPLDITRAREDLGFRPRHTLESGLRAFIDWWRLSEQPSTTEPVGR